MVRVRGGQIVEAWKGNCFDFLSMRQQLDG